jgi:hydrogenase 3 maturation protease
MMNLHDFENALRDYPVNKIVFIGLGNPLRGDDAAGLIFLNRLHALNQFKEAYFIEVGTNPENYLQQIVNCPASLVVFIDTSKWGGQPGEITWLPSDKIETIAISTHAFSIKMVEEYLQSERQFDFRYLVIEPEQMDMGESLSKSVSKSLDKFFESP